MKEAFPQSVGEWVEKEETTSLFVKNEEFQIFYQTLADEVEGIKKPYLA